MCSPNVHLLRDLQKTTDNLQHEWSARLKELLKISGQFQSEETAGHYTAIKSYIETCYRNGINETEALLRLCEGRPYTIEEIFANNSGE